MLSEKPWRKEFDKLTQEMRARWNGQIEGVVDPDDRSSASLLHDTYVYPTYKTTIDDFPVQVTISEFPLPGINVMAAFDNVEFLSVFVAAPCSLSAAIRHEIFMDRIKKKIGLEFEAQTGNTSFDKRYFIISRPKEDISDLKSIQVQEKIMNLEPFSGLYFASGGISLSHSIDSSDTLNIRNIEPIIKHLIDLAKSVSKNR